MVSASVLYWNSKGAIVCSGDVERRLHAIASESEKPGSGEPGNAKAGIRLQSDRPVTDQELQRRPKATLTPLMSGQPPAVTRSQIVYHIILTAGLIRDGIKHLSSYNCAETNKQKERRANVKSPTYAASSLGRGFEHV